MRSFLATRPYDDAFLLAYSEEHVAYEVEMLTWLVYVGLPGAAPGSALNNALLESFALHLRNVIDFLYLKEPKPDDVIADDYCRPGIWVEARADLSKSLEAARTRANKEVAHLTSARITGVPPSKGWRAGALYAELRPIVAKLDSEARPGILSPKVLAALR